jgi:hypothetical protein
MTMKTCSAFLFLAVLICAACAARPAPAQFPFPSESESAQQDQPKQGKKKSEQEKKTEPEKKTPDPKTPASPQSDIFAQNPSTGGQVLSFFNPQMMGDFSVYSTRRYVSFLATQMTTNSVTSYKGGYTNLPVKVTRVTTVTTQLEQSRAVWVPYANRGAFNIAENESPMPQDRVFITGNGFSDVRGPQPNLPVATATTSTQTTGVGFNAVKTSSTVTTVIPGDANVHLFRETFGFEKTFLNGAASIEIRAPVSQQASNIGGFATDDFGDLTVIGKYAIYLDRAAGNVVSGGLAVTAPSSGSILTTDGDIHSTLIQPFVGYLWNFNRFYLQAFHSVVVPTDSRDVTLLFNDVGLNYWLYRNQDGRLRFVVPMVEAHVATPLNHRGDYTNDLLYVPDTVVMTTGVHFGLFKNATLSVGAATPVTAPRIFGVEGFVQLNWRY